MLSSYLNNEVDATPYITDYNADWFLRGCIPIFNKSNYMIPLIICGSDSKLTAKVTKLLKHLKVCMGADSGSLYSNHSHSSYAFHWASKELLAFFSGTDKSLQQFTQKDWLRLKENLSSAQKVEKAVSNIDINKIFNTYSPQFQREEGQRSLELDQYSKAEEEKNLKPIPFLYGWKHSSNGPLLAIWKKVFPKARVLLVQPSVKTPSHTPFPRQEDLKGLDQHTFRADKLTRASVNALVSWLGLQILSQADYKELMAKL